jgi:hypothetical protein
MEERYLNMMKFNIRRPKNRMPYLTSVPLFPVSFIYPEKEMCGVVGSSHCQANQLAVTRNDAASSSLLRHGCYELQRNMAF